MNMNRQLLGAFVGFGALIAAGAALANPITVNGGGSLTCNGVSIGACQAFTGAGGGASGGGPTGLGVLSATNADTYTGTPSSEANEAARLNTLAGTSFTGPDGVRTIGSGGDQTFTTLAAWVVLRIGNVAIFIKNISGGSLTVAYVATPGTGRGLSHYTAFGANAVPLPGAAWLMIAGLGGLAASGRRKKASV